MLKITKIRKVIHKGMGTLGSWPAAGKGVLKKGVLENFSRSHRKTKPQACNFIKRDFDTGVFL